MNEILKWRYEQKVLHTVDALNKKQFDGVFAADLDSAKKIILDMIPKGSSIGLGGSVTINDMGILDVFRAGDYNLIDRYNQPNFDEVLDRYRDALTADFFVTGSSAVTQSGEIVNLDCTGNRVGAIGFGPKKVIIIIGVNKIVKNIEDGMKRCKEIAPSNSKRLGHITPCVNDGICTNCTVQQCICNITSIVHNCYKFPKRITVIVIPQILGF